MSFCLSIPSPKRHTQHQSLSRRAQNRWRPIGKKRRRLLRATTTTGRRRVPTRSSGTRNPARFRRAKTSSARPSTRDGRPKALQILSAIICVVVVVVVIQVATTTTTRVSPRIIIIRLNSSSRRSSTATEAKSARNFARKKRSNVS